MSLSDLKNKIPELLQDKANELIQSLDFSVLKQFLLGRKPIPLMYSFIHNEINVIHLLDQASFTEKTNQTYFKLQKESDTKEASQDRLEESLDFKLKNRLDENLEALRRDMGFSRNKQIEEEKLVSNYRRQMQELNSQSSSVQQKLQETLSKIREIEKNREIHTNLESAEGYVSISQQGSGNYQSIMPEHQKHHNKRHHRHPFNSDRELAPLRMEEDRLERQKSSLALQTRQIRSELLKADASYNTTSLNINTLKHSISNIEYELQPLPRKAQERNSRKKERDRRQLARHDSLDQLSHDNRQRLKQELSKITQELQTLKLSLVNQAQNSSYDIYYKTLESHLQNHRLNPNKETYHALQVLMQKYKQYLNMEIERNKKEQINALNQRQLTQSESELAKSMHQLGTLPEQNKQLEENNHHLNEQNSQLENTNSELESHTIPELKKQQKHALIASASQFVVGGGIVAPIVISATLPFLAIPGGLVVGAIIATGFAVHYYSKKKKTMDQKNTNSITMRNNEDQIEYNKSEIEQNKIKTQQIEQQTVPQLKEKINSLQKLKETLDKDFIAHQEQMTQLWSELQTIHSPESSLIVPISSSVVNFRGKQGFFTEPSAPPPDYDDICPSSQGDYKVT